MGARASLQRRSDGFWQRTRLALWASVLCARESVPHGMHYAGTPSPLGRGVHGGRGGGGGGGGKGVPRVRR